MEIGDLDKFEHFAVRFNNLSGPIPSKLFNISALKYLYLSCNSLSGILPLEMGYSLRQWQVKDCSGRGGGGIIYDRRGVRQ